MQPLWANLKVNLKFSDEEVQSRKTHSELAAWKKTHNWCVGDISTNSSYELKGMGVGWREEGRAKAGETLRGAIWPFVHGSLFRATVPARFRRGERETQLIFILEHLTKVLRHHAGQ